MLSQALLTPIDSGRAHGWHWPALRLWVRHSATLSVAPYLVALNIWFLWFSLYPTGHTMLLWRMVQSESFALVLWNSQTPF